MISNKYEFLLKLPQPQPTVPQIVGTMTETETVSCLILPNVKAPSPVVRSKWISRILAEI